MANLQSVMVRGRLMQGASLLRRNWLFVVFFLAGVGLRLAVTIAYWPALELYGDSYDYLAHASAFQPGVWNPAGYSIFLRILTPLGNLGVVPIIQHVMGLGLGVGVYVVLRRFEVRRSLAALGSAPILLDAYQIEIEQYVLAETITEVLLFAALAILLWRQRVSVLRAGAVALLLVGAAISRSVALPLLVIAGIYLLVRARWRPFLTYSAVAAAAFLAYCGWYASTVGYFGFPSFSGYFLYGRVATFATCEYPLTPPQRLLCPPQPVSQRPYNLDYYVWSSGSPIHRYFGPYAANSVAKAFSEKVILNQPVDYAKAVFDDTWHYFTPGRWIQPNGDVIDFRRWQFPGPHLDSLSGLKVNGVLQPLYVFFANKGFDLKPITASPDAALMGPLRTYQAGAYTPGPILLASLLGALAVGVFRRRSDHRRRPARRAALVLGLCGFLLLLVPSMTTGFGYRFLLPTLVLLPPAGALAADVGLDALARRRARRGPITEDDGAIQGQPPPTRPALTDTRGSAREPAL
jgi:hypothetical protein